MAVANPAREGDSMNLGPLSAQTWPVPVFNLPTVQSFSFEWECAYCGSILAGDLHKCPNCGAPHIAAGDSMRGMLVVNGMSASEFERAAREAQKRALVFRPFHKG